MICTVKIKHTQVLDGDAKNALDALEKLADDLSALPYLARIQDNLDAVADAVHEMDCTIGQQADKIDEIENDLTWAESRAEDYGNDLSKAEDEIAELNLLPETISITFDRHPHLLDDLRALEHAMRVDGYHANAEIIDLALSTLEQFQKLTA
jgi:predicted  nucleic acid-binding Zn-ribbon protein